MPKKITILTLIIILSGMFVLLITPIAPVLAVDTIEEQQRQALEEIQKKSGYTGTAGPVAPATISEKIGKIIAVVLAFLGVMFLVIVIYSGIQWMTAGGNEEKVTKARTRMINAVIGLVIVMIAYGITYFVISRLKESFIEAGRAGEEIEAPNQQE